jgi:HSP20 family protein
VTGKRRDVDDLRGEITELFAELWQVPRFSGMRRGFRPQCDCFRTDDPPELHVVVELPGVEPGSVNVSAAGNALVVSGTRARPYALGARYHQMEIEYGPFQRRLDLGADVDATEAESSYENGMLTIVLPLTGQP